MNEHYLIHWCIINIMIYDECGEQFKNKECDEEFPKAQDLEHHMIQKHASTLHKEQHAQDYFQCEHCNATVKSSKSL